MKVFMNKYKIPVGFAADEKCLEMLNKIQNKYLVTRSSALQIILHQISSSDFEKYFIKEKNTDKGKRLISQKVFYKKKRKK